MIIATVRELKRARHWRRKICPHGRMYADADCRQCPYPMYGYDKPFTIGDIARAVRRVLR